MIHLVNTNTFSLSSFQEAFEEVKVTKNYKSEGNITNVLKKYNQRGQLILKRKEELRMKVKHSVDKSHMSFLDLASPFRGRSTFTKRSQQRPSREKTSSQLQVGNHPASGRLSSDREDSSRILLTIRHFQTARNDNRDNTGISLMQRDDDTKLSH